MTRQANETQEGRAEAGAGRQRTGGVSQRGRVRLGAVIAVVVAVGFIVWAAVGSGGSGGGSSAPGQKVKGTKPVAVSYSGLKTLASALQQPIYWIGTRPNRMYEPRQTGDARVYVRYLPPGVKAGDPRGLLTVGTYPMKNAFSITQQAARGAVQLQPGKGGVAFHGKGDQARAYVAFPGSNYQIEIYSPTPGVASRLVEQGAVTAVPASTPTK